MRQFFREIFCYLATGHNWSRAWASGPGGMILSQRCLRCDAKHVTRVPVN